MVPKDQRNNVASLWEDARWQPRKHARRIGGRYRPNPTPGRYALYVAIALLSTAAWAYDPNHSFPIVSTVACLVFLILVPPRGVGRRQ
jgi:hypothetical protein